MTSDAWSAARPTESGLYLFYGEIGGYAPPRFTLCEVRPHALVVGDKFMEPSEMVGAWRPFDEKPPEL